MLELGASFKKARESRNITIDRIAVETRISTRFLLAIENEQFDLLPGGIFNRGFIRTYADRVGLDPEEAIRTYEKLSRPLEVETPRHETERVTGKTTKIPVYYAAIAGLVILVVAFYLVTRHLESAPAAASSKPIEAPATPAVTKAEEPPPPVPDAVPAPDPTTSTIAAVPAKVEVPPAAAVPAPAALPQTVSSAPIVIEFEIREQTWLKLTADGNAVVAGEVLSAGTTRRYTANNTMDMSIGNAAGVQLRVNGQPVSSLGRTGQVRNLTINPKTSAESLASK